MNAVVLKVTYSEKNRLVNNSGIALRQLITSFIPNGIAEYQYKKHQLTESVGYEKNAFEFKFTALPKELSRFFTESALGITDTLSVSDMVLSDNRFNLKDGKVEIERASEAKIKVEPNRIDRCKLRFKTGKYSPSIEFNADFLVMPNPITFKNSLFIKTKLFSFEIIKVRELTFDAKIHFTIKNNVDLDEAVNFFKLFAPENSNKEFTIELESLKENTVTTFSIYLEHKFPSAELIVDAISVLKQSYGIEGNRITTLDELYGQMYRLYALSYIVQNKIDEIEFKITPEFNELTASTLEEVEAPFTVIASIGSVYIGVIALLYGRKISDCEYKAYKADILEPLVFHGEEPSSSLLLDLQEQALKRLE